jgi:hypothetical protein
MPYHRPRLPSALASVLAAAGIVLAVRVATVVLVLTAAAVGMSHQNSCRTSSTRAWSGRTSIGVWRTRAAGRKPGCYGTAG